MPQAYRVRSLVSEDGGLRLDNLPFKPGEEVEVIVLAEEAAASSGSSYPLRGTPVTYSDPLAPVAEPDWQAAR